MPELGLAVDSQQSVATLTPIRRASLNIAVERFRFGIICEEEKGGLMTLMAYHPTELLSADTFSVFYFYS
jgi:hypothetical protein